MHEDEHPSLPQVFPSSHSSSSTTKPFPQEEVDSRTMCTKPWLPEPIKGSAPPPVPAGSGTSSAKASSVGTPTQRSMGDVVCVD
eukprot:588472-Rhodomonas_salina.2